MTKVIELLVGLSRRGGVAMLSLFVALTLMPTIAFGQTGVTWDATAAQTGAESAASGNTGALIGIAAVFVGAAVIFGLIRMARRG
jgi:hypothetical protein